MLAATALGLATVWIGAFDDKAVRQILAAPAQQLPVAMLPVGYPAEQPEPRGRRSLDELVHKIG
jgi:nitroreductase